MTAGRSVLSGIVIGIIALVGFTDGAAAQDAATRPSAPTPAPSAAPAGGPRYASAADLFKHVSPSVVRVIAIDKRGRSMGQGSGFVATADGVVVTNYHVVKGSASLTVLLEGDVKLDVVGTAAVDPDGDLALVRVTGRVPPALDVAATLPEIGTRAYAIGNPLGLTNTLSEGLVSGLRKEGEALTFIQTTTPISPGSSGGPLVDEAGNVLGVTTMCLVAGQNLNFVVEGRRIRKLLSDYQGGLTRKVEQAWAPSRGERSQASQWLARARLEAARMRHGQERYCAEIAGAYASIGDREGCLRTLEQWHMSIGNGDASWYQEASAIAVRARLGDAAGATADVEASPNPRTRMYGYLFIAQALDVSGDAKGYAHYRRLAGELALKQADPIIRADALVAIVQADADSGRFAEAGKVCALLTDTDDPELDAQGARGGVRRNVRSVGLAHVGIARARAGDFDEAVALADQMFDRTDRAFLMLCIVERMAESKTAVPGAAVLARRITRMDYRARALLAAAGGLIAQGDRAAGRDAITWARAAAKEVAENALRGEIDTALAGVLADGGEFDSAERVAAAITGERYRSAATARIAVAYARRGDYQQMTRTLAKVANPLDAIPCYNQIAVLQARAGHLKAACETAGRISYGFARGEAARAITKASAERFSPNEVARVVAAFKTSDERAAGYLGLAEGLIGLDQKTATSGATVGTKAVAGVRE